MTGCSLLIAVLARRRITIKYDNNNLPIVTRNTIRDTGNTILLIWWLGIPWGQIAPISQLYWKSVSWILDHSPLKPCKLVTLSETVILIWLVFASHSTPCSWMRHLLQTSWVCMRRSPLFTNLLSQYRLKIWSSRYAIYSLPEVSFRSDLASPWPHSCISEEFPELVAELGSQRNNMGDFNIHMNISSEPPYCGISKNNWYFHADNEGNDPQ